MTETPKKKKTTAVVKKNIAIAETNLFKSGSGFEQFDASEDLIVPYVKIMQLLSPEVIEEGSKVKAGDLLNSLSKFDYGTALKFIPLEFRKRRIFWIPRKEGGGMKCASMDSRVPDTGECFAKECKFCDHKNWLNNEPPACTIIYGFPAIVLGVDQEHKLVIVSFAVTSFKSGKELINKLRSAGGDIFGKPFEVFTKKEENDKGIFWTLKTKPAGLLTKKEEIEAENYYDLIQTAVVSYHEEDTQIKTEDDDSSPF